MEIRIVATGKGFRKAVENARSRRGTYNPSRQTWTIPAAIAASLSVEPRYLGWQVVTPAAAPTVERCSYWTREQGCPLHGETCHG